MNIQIKQQIENLFCKPLIGLPVPTNQGGHAGRAVETILENLGAPVQRGEGADFSISINVVGITFYIEIKTRDKSAVSPHTVGTINPECINVKYEDSNIWQKLQYQIRVITENGIIIKTDLYDFTRQHIQQKFKEAYEHGIKQIIANPNITCTHVDGHWGYFEKCNSKSNSFYFRLSCDDMPAIERMAKTVELFEEVE